jgi:hypothetical protein
VIAALATSGCGGGASNAIDPIAKAASTSTGAAGYKVNLTMQLTSPALPSGITGTGSGAFDLKGHGGTFNLNMNLGNDPQVTQALGGSTLQVQEVIKAPIIYMKLPAALSSRLPGGGKPWLKLDLSKASGLPGVSSLAGNPASSDPSQLLQFLRGVGGGVKKVGSEQVNGVQTTRYHAEISLDKVAQSLPESSRKAAEQSIKSLEKLTNLKGLPVDVWVDSGNLVRRMRMSFDESPSGQTIHAVITMDFSDYGPQPPPSIPPADQVSDISSLGGLGGTSSTP